MPAPDASGSPAARARIQETIKLLVALGLPRAQQNERSALTLLALLDLRPDKTWLECASPLRGITEMMEFFSEHYGKRYAPNTRETVRRQTVHQFLQAGLVVQNPDDPARPTNSPDNVYQVHPTLLELLRTFGKPQWERLLRIHLASLPMLRERYAAERSLRRLPLRLTADQAIELSPGGQNVLVKAIVEEFCPIFTPGAVPLYVGDTQRKWAYFRPELLGTIGVKLDGHGKMPDVVVYMEDRRWLVLVEAVTSHGPVSAKRLTELKTLFKTSTAGLLFVSAFPDRPTFQKFLQEIAWETEVWIAETPTHLIHFNGERFLGPRG